MSIYTPEISVVMPAYNAGLYVAEAIESILEQTFKDFEFIIIDDGSVDNSKEIIESYAKLDKRIRFYSYPKNKGLVHASNKGLELAEAPYIALMDADDIALPERFERQLAYMKGNSNVAVLGSAIELIDKKGAVIKRVFYPSKVEKDKLLVESLVANPTALIRRDVIASVGNYRKAYKYCQDYDLWLRIIEKNEWSIENLREVLLKYRQHDAKVSFCNHERQALGAEISKLAMRVRQQGKSDPTDGLESLDMNGFNLFDLPKELLDNAKSKVIAAKLYQIIFCDDNIESLNDFYHRLYGEKGLNKTDRARLLLTAAKCYAQVKRYDKASICLLKSIVNDYRILCKKLKVKTLERLDGQ